MRTLAPHALVMCMTNLNAVIQFEDEFGTLILGKCKLVIVIGEIAQYARHS
jgi:hypothetical protein